MAVINDRYFKILLKTLYIITAQLLQVKERQYGIKLCLQRLFVHVCIGYFINQCGD